MILITEELPTQITFENTRSGETFHASLREGTEEWTVVRYGTPGTGFLPDIWGRVERRDDIWYSFSGTLPGVEPKRYRDRDDALDWVINDR